MFVSCVHPVAVLNAAFCVICSLFMLVEDASRDHMVEAYSSEGLVMALYMATRISFCLPHAVSLNAFNMCSVLCVLFVMFSMCLLYVSLGSNVTPIIFGGVFVGSVVLSICS